MDFFRGNRIGSRMILPLITVLTTLSGVRAQVQPPSGDPSIIPPGARMEKLFEGACLLSEGVAAGHDGMIYFSDISFTAKCRDDKGVLEAGHIWRYNPATGMTSIFRSPSGMSNGIKFDADGNMIVAEGADYGGRRVIRTDMQTGKSHIIAGLYEGRPFNAPNDITIDEKGAIYFSDPRYLGHEPVEQPLNAVYRINPDGSIDRVITDAGKPNGIAISPSQKTLYVVCHDNGSTGMFRLPEGTDIRKGQMALLAYDLTADGSASFNRTLVDYSPEDGPDGLVPDVDGNIYVAERADSRFGVAVYSPGGEELAHIPTEYKPTNVGFGRGEASKTLYITAGAGLYRIRLLKEGYHVGRR